MKKSLRIIAVILLLAGIASAGLAVWSYYRAREQYVTFRELQRKAVELEDRSDAVKGTPEEERLLNESQKYNQPAVEALASVESSRLWARIFVGGSIVLILASIAAMVLHLTKKEARSSA
jgi:hypothetical protein